MTDNEKVLRYMRLYGSISQREAFLTLGCGRLSARVWELRRKGYNIITERVPFDKDGVKSTYARYWLKEEQDAG